MRLIITILTCLILVSCQTTPKPQPKKVVHSDLYDLEEIQQSGEIIVLTLYGPTSYFDYRGAMIGYQYQVSEQFGESIGAKVRVEVARTVEEMVTKLKNGDGDVIAYNLPVTNEYKKDLQYCGEEIITNQILVQPKGKNQIKDVTELVGKDIYVSRKRYADRLKNLNNELGGGIKIHVIPADSLTTEELIEKVAKGQIPLTISENDLLQFNQRTYPNLDFSLKVSFEQRASWAVRKDSPNLAKAIDEWFKESTQKRAYLASAERYYEKDKPVQAVVHRKAPILNASAGIISTYDALFKRYSRQIGWDWRLMAAQAYQESGFDPQAVSWAGARGLMQIMPRTAQGIGVEVDALFDPETSVSAAATIMKQLNNTYSDVHDQTERIKFMLASYNCGAGHVADARALAEKYGKDPRVWTGNVDRFILLLREEEYYNDPVVKYGYFRSSETYNYVIQIMDMWRQYQSKIR